MVLAVEARKLNLPYLSLSSPQVTSLLYDPSSLSLALMHADSTVSLYPNFSPFSLSSPSLPPPQTLVPAPNSSACFVTLNPNPNSSPNPRVVFVTAGPNNGGSRVVLGFHMLGDNGKFVRTRVICSQNGVSFDGKCGVSVDVSHGMKVMLSGGVNYLALYSVSAAKLWVFGVKLVEDGRSLRLVKCAVIDCQLPVFSISVSFGYLILGELHGVRVFPLRALVKGNVGSKRRVRVVRGKIENYNQGQQDVWRGLEVRIRNLKMPNGVVRSLGENVAREKNLVHAYEAKSLANGNVHSLAQKESSKLNGDGDHENAADLVL